MDEIEDRKNDSILERLARLEEKGVAAAKALDLAQGSIAQAASLDKRVIVLETHMTSDSDKRIGNQDLWSKIVTIISLIIAGLVLFLKR